MPSPLAEVAGAENSEMPAEAAPSRNRNTLDSASSRRCNGRSGRPIGSGTCSTGERDARGGDDGKRHAAQRAEREQYPRDQRKAVLAQQSAEPDCKPQCEHHQDGGQV